MNIKKIIKELTRLGIFSECSPEEYKIYNENVMQNKEISNKIKIGEKVYNIPESFSTEELLYILVYTNNRIEEHLGFLKAIVIVGVILTVLGLLISATV